VAFLIILILLILFWFLIVMPQRRRQRAHTAMQDSVVVGDEIITAGGLHGEVVSVGAEVVQIEIARDVVVRLDRRAIAAVARELDEEELEDEEDAAELEEADPDLDEQGAEAGEDAKAR
jgi:preprotein translocase subunit YajC